MAAKTALTMAALICICANSMDAAKPLPSIIKPCPKNDPKLNECAVVSGNLAIPKLKSGIPSLGVPPMDPFFVKKINVEGNGIGVHLIFRDVNLHGLSDTKVTSIRITHDPPNFIWNIHIPVMQMIGKYEASGKVLLLPITGKGDFNVTMFGMDVQYEFSCDTVKRSDGELYYSPSSNKVEYSVKKVSFQMENLFNGNKLLGDEMNRFLNENWREVDKSWGPEVAESVVGAMTVVTRAITSKVPVKNFWTYVRKIRVENGGMGISMQSVNVRIHGLSKSKPIGQWMNKVSPPSFRWNLFAPRLEINSNHEVHRRILLLPIVGKGNLNITLTDVDYVYSFDCDLERREDGKEYLVPRTSHIDFKSSRMHTTLTNLFNGNKLLGNQMNYFLNENWREIQKEFGPPIADALAKAIRKIVNGITRKVPLDAIFPEEV
ncbi:protein takeout-like [Ischnura elegans]|uniref:protein takeout-like n=1 Tax=Ischnura elegans TaxID=197161 RepID=UPI001ED885A3|nr:protein takeout-like [Ischnura elegans]